MYIYINMFDIYLNIYVFAYMCIHIYMYNGVIPSGGALGGWKKY